MSGKWLAVLLLAFAAAVYAAPSTYPTGEVFECDKLPTEAQEYVNKQLSTLPEGEEEIELTHPPQALIEAVTKSKENSRAKRRTRVCRYVAIANRRTKKAVVIVRCR